MAVGGAILNVESVSTGGTMDIRSTTGIYWLIQNITWSGPITLARATTSLTGIFLTATEAGGFFDATFLVTEASYLKVSNSSTAANVCSYDGMLWSE